MRFLAAVFVILAGCSETGIPKSDKPDAWLEVLNVFGEWERVALVFGYFDDYSGCKDIADALHDKFQREYRCVPTK